MVENFPEIKMQFFRLNYFEFWYGKFKMGILGSIPRDPNSPNAYCWYYKYLQPSESRDKPRTCSWDAEFSGLLVGKLWDVAIATQARGLRANHFI